MRFTDLFPADYRAFCRGPLSFCMERFGGIDSISLLDVREFNGKLYPDRFPVPWLRRRGRATMGRPLYSPAIQFRHGKINYVPEKAELYPFGFRSGEFSAAMNEKAMIFRFAPHPGERFIMTLSRLHMPEGVMPALKNQLAVIASGIQWLPPELRGPGFDPARPFPEKDMTLTRLPAVCRDGMLIFEADCQYADHAKKQFWVIRGNRPLAAFTEIPNGWTLEWEETGEPLELGFGFGTTVDEAAVQAAAPFDSVFQSGLEICRPSVEAEIDGLPEAAEFFRRYPGYQRHLLLTETADQAAIRAAADKYGYFALWDHVYPSRDFLLTGEPVRTRRMIRYLLDYPWVETCAWITMHLILALDEYLAFADDPDFLRECMPHLKRYLDFNETFVNPETGLLATSLNVGVDCSDEVGLNGLFYASCLNGWWYDSLRVLENFATETGDPALAERCRVLSEKVEAHYAEAFFDEQEGYLRAALKADGTLPDRIVYQNTHTLGMDYLYGARLFRRILPKLADYQAVRLWHPMGHTAVAYDSEVPCEMWKSVHMNQHLGHECKTARLGGRADEALHLMRGWLEYFSRYQCAVETFNLAGCDGDSNQLANWQAFSATAAAQGLFCGVGGWMYHRGGRCWVPGEGPDSRFRLQENVFRVSGQGGYAGGISVDGCRISGTLQTPADRPGNEYSVERTPELPAHPVLLCLADAPVSAVNLAGCRLRFICGASLRTFLKVQSPRKPQLRINGNAVEIEWFETEHRMEYDGVFHVGDEVEISAEC